jgi:hypothetical protein
VTIPADLAALFAACEAAYEHATGEGYAQGPAVSAAVTVLKSAWTALLAAHCKRIAASGLFGVAFATTRAHRACRATRKACTNLHAALEQAAAEHRLYNRCLMLTRPASETGPGQRQAA